MAEVLLPDGTLDFSGGVNSVKVTTVASDRNPGGLSRNELAWLINGTVRDGGITQTTGWIRLGRIHPGNALYQGGFLYEPAGADPYLVLCIGGETFKVIPDFANAPVNLTQAFSGTKNPAAIDQAFFCQAETFLIIQAGDQTTLPLFWDGTALRRSKGITNSAVPPGTPGVNEIPAGGPMDYYMGRLWWANGRQYSAGDITGGPAGIITPSRRDAILNVTENPLVLGGDGFTVPTQAGNIRAIFHNANLNTQLGQGQLFIGTRKAIYAQAVPVTRTDWISATAANGPSQTVAQLNFGPVNDRSIVKVNGDVFYQSLEPGIRSLFSAIRNFGEWQNTALSANIERILAFNDRSLMRFASGMQFDGRLLQGLLPKAMAQGVVTQVLAPLDFIPVSSFGGSRVPIWEGMMEGLPTLQFFVGDFGGLERAFAVVVSQLDGSIELWELTNFSRFNENLSGEARQTTIIEFPAYTWGQEFLLKKLAGCELWVDKLFGTVDFLMEYRPDSATCYLPWHQWKQCTAKNSCEDVFNPVCYPIDQYRESYRATMTLPKPPDSCEKPTGRPANVGYQFQPRLTFKGWCRIRGIQLFAEPVEKKMYQGIVC